MKGLFQDKKEGQGSPLAGLQGCIPSQGCGSGSPDAGSVPGPQHSYFDTELVLQGYLFQLIIEDGRLQEEKAQKSLGQSVSVVKHWQE